MFFWKLQQQLFYEMSNSRINWI